MVGCVTDLNVCDGITSRLPGFEETVTHREGGTALWYWGGKCLDPSPQCQMRGTWQHDPHITAVIE